MPITASAAWQKGTRLQFKRLDLNLLVTLDVLLSERSVSGAARRLNLSQPAMSGALSRLRTAFNDPIMVPHGKRMVPTAHALSLRPQLAEVLRGIGALTAMATLFDPATSDRIFRIATSDYIAMTLFPPLLRALAVSAPAMRLVIMPPGHANIVALDRGEIDLLITPEAFVAPDHPAALLWEERHVVAGWTENPVFARGLDEAAFFASGHVAVQFGGGREPAFVEQTMADFALRRRIEVIAPSFAAVPWLLPGTARLALMHERLANTIVAGVPVAIAAMPFPFPPMREMVQHHAARASDAGLQWLIGQIDTIAQSIV